jgi:hypothetical protein
VVINSAIVLLRCSLFVKTQKYLILSNMTTTRKPNIFPVPGTFFSELVWLSVHVPISRRSLVMGTQTNRSEKKEGDNVEWA